MREREENAMLINLRNALMAGKRKPTAKDYVQSGLVSQWDSFDGYNQTSGRFFDLVNDAEVSDSKITRTQGGLMNYTGIGLVNLRTGLTPPEDFTLEMCLNVNNVELVGSNRAEMMYAYGFTLLMKYSNDWFCNPTNAYVSYSGNFAPRFTASFQIAGTSTSPDYPRAGSLFFAGAKTRDLPAAKNVTGTTLAVGRNTYTNMNVDIYSLRLYSRALTADEIARNYAIDKERFHLP